MLPAEHGRLYAAAEHLLSEHPDLAFSPETLALIADTFANGNANCAEKILAGFEQLLSCAVARPKVTFRCEVLDLDMFGDGMRFKS